MPEWEASCNECEKSVSHENEERVLGWMFGHALRTGHEDIEKVEVEESE